MLVICIHMLWTSQVAQWVRNLPEMQEMQEIQAPSLSLKDPLEESMATHNQYS